MNSQDLLEIQQQCRTCYNSKNNLQLLKSLPESWTNQKEQKTYAELLTEVCNINVLEDVPSSGHWPQFICSDCCEKLQSAYDFIQQTHRTNNYFKSLASQYQTKLHFIEIHESEIKTETDNDKDLSDNEQLLRDIAWVGEEVANSECEDSTNIRNENSNDKIENLTTLNIEINNNSKVQCNKCNIILPNAKKLKNHKHRHCPHCDFIMKRSCNLKYHIRSKHPELIPDEKLDANAVTSSSNKNFNCKKCRTKCYTSRQLNRHNYRVHLNSEFIFLCSQCGGKFEESDEFKKHMLDEHAEDVVVKEIFKLSCNKCDFKALGRFHLNRHNHKIHRNDYFEDNDEESNEITNDDADDTSYHPKKAFTTKKLRKTLACTECNKLFTTKPKLNRHKRFSHVPEDKKHPCHLCNTKFSRKYHLKRHLKSLHSRNNDQTIVKKEKLQNDSNIAACMSCEVCGKSFANSRNLRRHQRLSHVPEEKKFVCNICGKKFGRSDTFRSHMAKLHKMEVSILKSKRQTGLNDQRFACDACDRSYTRRYRLYRHKRLKHT